VRGIDELWDGRRCSKVSDPLGLHNLFDGMLVLDKGDDPHLSFALGALKGIYFVDSLYARGPSASLEISPIVALSFFRWRRGELSAFTPSPTGVSSVVPCD
jgi:hypothetical protein